MLDVPKGPVGEPRKPEEESSFWKISAERSKLEREQSDFQSLTPSQIKSLEKGEKALPSYLRPVRRQPHPTESSAPPISALFLFLPGLPEGARACRPSACCCGAGQSHQAESAQAPGSSAAAGRRRQRHSGLHLHRAEPGPAGQRARRRRRLGALSEHPAVGQQRPGRNVLLQHVVQAFQHPRLCGQREGGRRIGIQFLLFPGELHQRLCFHMQQLRSSHVGLALSLCLSPPSVQHKQQHPEDRV